MNTLYMTNDNETELILSEQVKNRSYDRPAGSTRKEESSMSSFYDRINFLPCTDDKETEEIKDILKKYNVSDEDTGIVMGHVYALLNGAIDNTNAYYELVNAIETLADNDMQARILSAAEKNQADNLSVDFPGLSLPDTKDELPEEFTEELKYDPEALLSAIFADKEGTPESEQKEN